MILDMVKAWILGVVEGITEWLPISSTGHLILLGEMLSFSFITPGDPFGIRFTAFFDIAIQLGAILAVIVSCFSKLYPYSKTKTKAERKACFGLWFKILISALPCMIAAPVFTVLTKHFFGKRLSELLFTDFIVALALILYGIAFLVTEKQGENDIKFQSTEGITTKAAVHLGLFQVLSLIPGTSRSGATFLGASHLGLKRSEAAEFSFMMAIPVILGASVWEGRDLLLFLTEHPQSIPYQALPTLFVGFVTAFAVSLAVVRLLIAFLRKHTLVSFGIYRIIIGCIVLIRHFIMRFV